MRYDEQFEAAVSDTDILIDLFKSGSLKILGILFKKIYIPEYIYEVELTKVATRLKDIDFFELKKHINDENSLFTIIYDKDLDVMTKSLKNIIWSERKDIAGPGEVQCASYANASGINIVVSNNHTEFQYLNDIAVMLSFFHVLAVCVLHEKLTFSEAEILYNQVNNNKTHPSGHSFQEKFKRSKKYFIENHFVEVLHISNFNL